MKPPTQANEYNLEEVSRIRTHSSSFTTFVATLLYSNFEVGKIDSHITLVTSDGDKPSMPRLYLMDPTCKEVITNEYIEAMAPHKQHNPNATAKEGSTFTGKGKKKKKSKEEEIQTDSKSLEGNLSCMVFSDDCEAKQHPELFVGYESGAIGMFRLELQQESMRSTTPKFKIIKLFSAQKLIQDVEIKHVLSLAATHLSPEVQDFTLSIGYYSQRMQTISFIVGFENDSYTMMDQNITEPTYHTKPGVGCIATERVGNNALMASGGFDHRIRLVSLRTLKPLVYLQFHQGIVNNVIIERLGEDKVRLISSAEDGYVASWELQI